MMTEKTNQNRSAEETARDIRRATRRNYSAEEKIRILPGRYQYQYLLPLVKGISGSWEEVTSYSRLKRYQSGGIDGLEDRKPCPRLVWNKLPGNEIANKIRTAKSARLNRHVSMSITKSATADAVLPAISNRVASTEKLIIVGCLYRRYRSN
jgi:hypothetical protein